MNTQSKRICVNCLQDDFDVRLDNYVLALAPADGSDDFTYDSIQVVSFNNLSCLGCMIMKSLYEQQTGTDYEDGFRVQLKTREKFKPDTVPSQTQAHIEEEQKEVAKTSETKQVKRFHITK